MHLPGSRGWFIYVTAHVLFNITQYTKLGRAHGREEGRSATAKHALSQSTITINFHLERCRRTSLRQQQPLPLRRLVAYPPRSGHAAAAHLHTKNTTRTGSGTFLVQNGTRHSATGGPQCQRSCIRRTCNVCRRSTSLHELLHPNHRRTADSEVENQLALLHVAAMPF